MGEISQNTNLASEYYVLSMLYRIGANAYLTLGNKKSIDIVIDKKGKTITVDVKGLQGTTIFPLDNWNRIDKNHYLVFVSYLKHIQDWNEIPEVYIVPSTELKKYTYENPGKTRKGITLSKLRTLKKYQNKWEYFI